MVADVARGSIRVHALAQAQAQREAIMPRGWVTLALACVLLAWGVGPALAERRPQSREELESQAAHVVAGAVSGIEVREEASLVERGAGNLDSAVYCTIVVGEVRKGTEIRVGDKITARAFLPRKRASGLDAVSWGAHRPIPESGARTLAFLHARDAAGWYPVVHPNGFAAVGDEPLTEAAEVLALRGRGVETGAVLGLSWTHVVLGAAGAAGVALGIVRIARRRRPAGPSES